MGVLYRYDYIREGLSMPKVLSFRLRIALPEPLYSQLEKDDQLDAVAAPTSCFISQLYLQKADAAQYLVITVNLLGLYEKWTKYPYELTYQDIVYYLRKKLNVRLGKEFTEQYIRHETLDCDFIEYAFIAEGRNVVRDMAECHADSKQITKLYWDDYAAIYKRGLQGCSDFMTCIDCDYRGDDNEVYVRCYADALQDFFLALEKIDCIARTGVFLKYLYDDNFKRTICQCAYEHNCLRCIPPPKLLYDEFCREFGNPLEAESDAGYAKLD